MEREAGSLADRHARFRAVSDGTMWVGAADYLNYDPYICYYGQSTCDFAWEDHVLQGVSARLSFTHMRDPGPPHEGSDGAARGRWNAWKPVSGDQRAPSSPPGPGTRNKGEPHETT